jgi:hypothetical protein
MKSDRDHISKSLLYVTESHLREWHEQFCFLENIGPSALLLCKINSEHYEFEDGRFGDACCLDHQGDGGSKHPWNVGKLLSDYTLQQRNRQPAVFILAAVRTSSLTLRYSFTAVYCTTNLNAFRPKVAGLVAITPPASHSGGPGFKFRATDRLSWLRASWFSSVPPNKCLDNTIN